jgi:UDP-2,3-diacylglucosamine hydrolase
VKLPEIALPEGSLFVGDLHLDPEGGVRTDRFLRWLERTRGAPVLVILGDLFEYWIGSAQLAETAPVLAAMRASVEAGSAIALVPGNRDFLLDARFEERSGARVHPHGFVARTGAGERVLVVHGDELCTLDVGYQRLRRVLRSGAVRALAPRVPAFLARSVARRLRGASVRAVSQKPSRAMEQQRDACSELALRHGCRTLVCGHAHRFRDETLAGGVRWLVVDAFGDARDTLRVEGDGNVALVRAAAPADGDRGSA